MRQFMTETARLADIVLPATMFWSTTTFIAAAAINTSSWAKLIEPPGRMPQQS